MKNTILLIRKAFVIAAVGAGVLGFRAEGAGGAAAQTAVGEKTAAGYIVRLLDTSVYTLTAMLPKQEGFEAIFEVGKNGDLGEGAAAELIIQPPDSAETPLTAGGLRVYRQLNGVWQPQNVKILGGVYKHIVSGIGKYAVKYDNVYSAQSDSASGFKFIEVRQRIFTPEEASSKANRCIFSYNNPDYEPVSIRIFNAEGCLVRDNLAPNGSTGTIEEQYWDGKDNSGSSVKSGVYIYQMESGKIVQTGTVVVAK